MHRSRPRTTGFTLIEILCVVVILGIASALIIPQIGSRDDIKVASAARMVVSDILYAQNLAISRQKRHFVSFDAQQYAVQTRESDSDPLWTIMHPVTKDTYTVSFDPAVRGLEGVLIQSVDFGGTTFLVFDDLGMPFSFDGTNSAPLTATGTVTIRCGNQTLTISIEPFTGETSVN